MSDRLPINHGDTGLVSRNKINESFNDVVNTVASYRPHIEAGYWWIGDTNTGVKAQGDSIEMKVEDGYIWYKSESASWTQIIAIEDIKGDKGDTGNGIASIVATKVGKTTTVTITDTEGHEESFPIQDGQDGQMTGPSSSVDGHIAVFDGTSGTSLRDGGPVPEGNVKSFTLSSTSDLTNAQAAYDWYDDGNVAIIVYDDKEYLFDYATENNAYWCVANESAYDTTSATGIRRASLQLALSSGTVTAITTLNISVNDFNVLRTDKNYGTPYTPQYNGSPATKKYVDDKIADLMAIGHFLSLWDCSTGQPLSFPFSTPYTYHTGDIYMVEVVDTGDTPTNYRPNGSSYTGTASSTAETDEVAVGDFYVYDGSIWLLATNHGKAVSFANLAGSPDDNTALDNALNAKQDTLTAGTGINIDGNNEITNTGVTSVNGSTGAVTVEEAKVFEIADLTSAASLTTATQAYTYGYTNGKCAILRYSGGNYVYAWGNTTQAWFSRSYNYGAVSSGTWAYWRTLKLTVSSGSVTAIADNTNQINISSSAPSSSTSNSIITLVI